MPAMGITIIVAALFNWGCGRNGSSSASPKTPVTIEVTGVDYRWHVLNPGRDGALKTQDDILSIHRLNVPVNTPIHLVLHSEDYLYTFSVPEHDLKEIAVPDMTFTLDFELESTGQYELRCDQVCGVLRPMLLGRLVAMTEKDYRAWVNGGADGS